MPLSAHLGTLFTEVPLLERFAAAAEAGFAAVELWWPQGEDPGDVVAAARASDVRVVLLNFDGGDLAAGDRGLAGDPDREDHFRANVPVALELARALGCRQLNALPGLERPDLDRAEQVERARRNIAWAARLAARQDAVVLVEPINTLDNGPYLLPRADDVVAFLDAAGEPNLALQLDVFHSSRMGEDPVATIRRTMARIGHVQVADAPGRGEPGSGRVDFASVFATLRELGYPGHVGLEYVPAETTRAGLGWLDDMGFG